FGVFNVYCHNEFISRVISKNLRDFLKLVPIVRNSSPQLLLFPQCQRRLIADTLKTRDCHTTNTTHKSPQYSASSCKAGMTF
ncbi:MAG: hypothetical protein ACNYVW_04335, partial [Methanosarcinales archaeon]